MKRIVYFYDNKTFGNTISVYDNVEWYFIIVKDRGHYGYSVLSEDKERYYHVDSIIKKLGYKHKDEFEITSVINIDFSDLYVTDCPEYLDNLINGDYETQAIITFSEKRNIKTVRLLISVLFFITAVIYLAVSIDYLSLFISMPLILFFGRIIGKDIINFNKINKMIITNKCVIYNNSIYNYDEKQFILSIKNDKPKSILIAENEFQRHGRFPKIADFGWFDYNATFIIDELSRYIDLDKRDNW